MNIKKLNKLHLQLIAILAMTIDHLTWLIYPGYSNNVIAIIMHIIGRLAFPIMAYFIAEGYHYTRDKKKYLLRICIFSLISHVPYMMQSMSFREYGWLAIIPFATGEGITRFLNQASVLWAYFIGLLMLMINDSNKLKNWQKIFIIFLLCIVSFPADWSSIAALVILSIGSNRGKPFKQIIWSLFYVSIYALVYLFALDLIYGLIQFGVVLALLPLYFYNGKKSNNDRINRIMKWAFYIYYPFHLLILGIIGLFL